MLHSYPALVNVKPPTFVTRPKVLLGNNRNPATHILSVIRFCR